MNAYHINDPDGRLLKVVDIDHDGWMMQFILDEEGRMVQFTGHPGEPLAEAAYGIRDLPFGQYLYQAMRVEA